MIYTVEMKCGNPKLMDITTYILKLKTTNNEYTCGIPSDDNTASL